MTSVSCTSATEARIISVRSTTMDSSVPAGSARSRERNCARSAATVATMFAPGWRCTSTSTAGRPLYHAPVSVFSSPSTAVPTSLSRTGAPLRQAMMRFAKAAGVVSWSFAMTAEACCGPSTDPLGPATLAAATARAHVIEAEVVGCQPPRIDLQAHRRAHVALHGDAPDAADLR